MMQIQSKLQDSHLHCSSCTQSWIYPGTQAIETLIRKSKFEFQHPRDALF
jgi:hypothetical protein